MNHRTPEDRARERREVRRERVLLGGMAAIGVLAALFVWGLVQPQPSPGTVVEVRAPPYPTQLPYPTWPPDPTPTPTRTPMPTEAPTATTVACPGPPFSTCVEPTPPGPPEPPPTAVPTYPGRDLATPGVRYIMPAATQEPTPWTP